MRLWDQELHSGSAKEAQERLELLDLLARARGGADVRLVLVKTFHPAEGDVHSPGEPEDDTWKTAERSMGERRHE